MPRPPSVIVVGAGINGLVAAHYLRRAGCAVTVIERADRIGGACCFDAATVAGQTQRYSLGATVLGLMPDFIFRETGLADRLETFVPDDAKVVHFPGPQATASIHRDPIDLTRELASRWGERGDVAGFRADEARVIEYLQAGYRDGRPPDLAGARDAIGDPLTRLWITGSAVDLLDHYFTAERTRVYMAMTVTESGPVSLAEPYSAFTLPLMDSGSVFDGYYGFVKEGLWRLTEELDRINREIGVEVRLGAPVEEADLTRGELRVGGTSGRLRFDHLVLATDPVSAARLAGDGDLLASATGKRLLGTSGKITLLFREPVRWKDGTADTAFRFVFSVDSVAEFERATLQVTTGGAAYAPGYIQIYCEGAAMRRLGLVEPFDRVTLFFKNVAFDRPAEAHREIEEAVKSQVLARIANPGDCVWSRLLLPRDLERLFLFPAGNLDHTMLVGGQTFAERRFGAGDRFYQLGRWPNASICGAGTYPCGSIAGTPGYLCARELVRDVLLGASFTGG